MTYEGPPEDTAMTLEYIQKGWFGQKVEVRIKGTGGTILEFCKRHLDHGKIDWTRVMKEDQSDL